MNNQDILNIPININTKPKKIKVIKNNTIQSIRKIRIKKDIVNNPNISKKDVLLNNGYALSTATHKASSNKLLNEAIAEVAEELRAEGVDRDWLLSELRSVQKQCLEAGDRTNLLRALENIARYVAQIPEKSIQKIYISEADKAEYEHLRGLLGVSVDIPRG